MRFLYVSDLFATSFGLRIKGYCLYDWASLVEISILAAGMEAQTIISQWQLVGNTSWWNGILLQPWSNQRVAMSI